MHKGDALEVNLVMAWKFPSNLPLPFSKLIIGCQGMTSTLLVGKVFARYDIVFCVGTYLEMKLSSLLGPHPTIYCTFIDNSDSPVETDNREYSHIQELLKC